MAVRQILLQKKISGDYKVQRLGHAGVAGEYLHGIGLLHNDIDFYKEDPNQFPISNALNELTDCFNKPSQLSEMSQSISKEHQKNENSFDAIPRAIEDTRKWAETADLSLSEKANMATLLAECTEQYAVVRAFAEKCRDMAPS